MLLNIAANIGLLAYYKYANFFADSYNQTAVWLGLDPVTWEKILLPLGISFFTFQGMSYVIDVYRKDVTYQPDFLKLSLYISFFPQLIAGPIVRYKDVAEQIEQRQVGIPLFYSGVKRFITGLAKKVLIANMLGRVPHFVYQMPADEYNWLFSWLALIAGGLQMYFDFSGYSDMAIGLGRMFGFKFLENFNFPYSSTSIKEFWNRWHISLSRWFRDYVYIPLGGNRKGEIRTYINLWIVFLLTGLWHGANWTFIMFGVIHGVFLTLERTGLERLLKYIPKIFRRVYVFLVFASSIVLFDMKNLHQGALFFRSLFISPPVNWYSKLFLYLTPEWFFIAALAVFFSGLAAGRMVQYIKNESLKKYTEVILLILIFVLSIAEMSSSSFNPFIYFRF